MFGSKGDNVSVFLESLCTDAVMHDIMVEEDPGVFENNGQLE